MEIDISGKKISYQLGVTGKHQAVNSCGVLAAVQAAGGNLNIAMDNFSNLEAKPGRGKIQDIIFENKKITIIDDTYNASPTSVEAAITNLGGMDINGRKIVVLGDMFELGEDAPQIHKSLADIVIKNNIDLLFTAGELTLNLYNALPDNIKGDNAKNAEELGAKLANLSKNRRCYINKRAPVVWQWKK